MIRVQNINKIFKSKAGDVEALKNVSLNIKKGEKYGVIGYSGAGKSTLVRCLNFLELPDSGSVEINGKKIEAVNGNLYQNGKKISEKELNNLRRNIGMIFQHFNLLDRSSVFDNVAYPLKYTGKTKNEINQKVMSLLELVGLKEKADSYPTELSGGQKQRVAIARALANDPNILLSDEAPSALDPEATESILKLLNKLNKELGLTIVIITHEMGVIKSVCDRVAVMKDGEVVESGEVYDIFLNPKEEITKKFINSTSSLSKIDTLINSNSSIVMGENGKVKLYKLTFDKEVNSPVISEASRTFGVDFNILLSNVEVIGSNTIGAMIVKISGEKEKIEESLNHLKSSNIKVEVLE